MEGEQNDMGLDTTDADVEAETITVWDLFIRVLQALWRAARWLGGLLGALVVVVSRYLWKVILRKLAQLAIVVAVFCVLGLLAKYFVVPFAVSMFQIHA